jgi:hypothetical protein
MTERYHDSCRCGATFKSPAAEARHRHNFPLLCREVKLSPSQKIALAKFKSDTRYTARQADENIRTLRALVSKGLLIERRRVWEQTTIKDADYFMFMLPAAAESPAAKAAREEYATDLDGMSLGELEASLKVAQSELDDRESWAEALSAQIAHVNRNYFNDPID